MFDTFHTAPTGGTPTQANRPTRWLLAALAVALLWDASGADLPVMQWLGTAQGFPLRNHWLLERVLHEGLRQAFTGLFWLMVVWALWPTRWERPALCWLQLPRRERLGLVLLVLLSLLAVNLIKVQSQTSCPWELQDFGGRAAYVSHWNLWHADGGAGRCFPGGHASSALAFVALCLPWLSPPENQGPRRRTVGLRWLVTMVFLGLVAGGVQTLRGAHYPSHTLWTLVVCGSVSVMGWRLLHPVRRAPRPTPQAPCLDKRF
ncbi:MAG: phosphatase PAP2 family protein [Hydrogenophaga sp.]|nr:phosphatase PAP2 family protein [Hydrogenophaga sp.]